LVLAQVAGECKEVGGEWGFGFRFQGTLTPALSRREREVGNVAAPGAGGGAGEFEDFGPRPFGRA
jgi:hypothetical protein